MARITVGMLVCLSDKDLLKKHGEDPCRILNVERKKEGGESVPARIVLTDFSGNKFEAQSHQFCPY